MKKVQWDPKKIHATSPQKIGTGRLRTLEIKKIQRVTVRGHLFQSKQRQRCCAHGRHGGEKRCAAHVMRGPRSCSVVSAQGRIACRVRSARSQRGERWEPFRRGQLLRREHVGTPREGCSPCPHYVHARWCNLREE